VTVTPGAPAGFIFLKNPTTTVLQSLISPAVKVSIEDAYGNLPTQDNSTVVTVSLGDNVSGGRLSGTTEEVVSQGVATFSDLSVNKVGSYILIAGISGSASTATSGTFEVIWPSLETVIWIAGVQESENEFLRYDYLYKLNWEQAAFSSFEKQWDIVFLYPKKAPVSYRLKKLNITILPKALLVPSVPKPMLPPIQASHQVVP
jgi:hypothetical protein